MTTTSPRAVADPAGPSRRAYRAGDPPPVAGAVRDGRVDDPAQPAAMAAGEPIVVARDARGATHDALVISGAVPVWVAPRVDPYFNLSTGVPAADVADTLAHTPGARTVHIVSPTEAGVRSDLDALRTLAADRGVQVSVDSSWSRPRPATEATRFARTLLDRIPGIHVISAADLALPVDRLDPATIVLEVRGRGVDGPRAARQLREDHGVEVAGSDATRVYLRIGEDHDTTAVRRLVVAVSSVGAWSGPARTSRPDPLAVLPPPGEQVLTPREAWLSGTVTVPLGRAVGRVCGEVLSPCRPGVAVAVPGEVLTAATVAWLLESVACGVRIRGAQDPTLATLRVVAGW